MCCMISSFICTRLHPSHLKRHIVDRNSWARPVARNAFLLNELNAIKEGRKQDVSRDQVQLCMRDLRILDETTQIHKMRRAITYIWSRNTQLQDTSRDVQVCMRELRILDE